MANNTATQRPPPILTLQVVRHSEIQKLISRDNSATISVIMCSIQHTYKISAMHAEAIVDVLDELDREKKSFAKAGQSRGEESTRRVGAVQPQKKK